MPPLLPPTYFLDHFRQVLCDVQTRCGSLLNQRERDYCTRIEALPEAALCLYVRLTNRRGPYFRLSKLSYAEVPDIAAAVEELEAAGLLCRCTIDLTFSLLMDCFTFPELRAALPRTKQARKPDMVSWIATWEDREMWLSALLAEEPLVSLTPDDPWGFLRFLFFGESVENLSGFVTQALGHVVPEFVDPQSLTAHFCTRKEAEDTFRLSQLYAEFRLRREVQEARDLYAWWHAQAMDRTLLETKAHSLHDRLIERLGRLLEREGAVEEAMHLYTQSPVAPMRERLVRLWMKAGRAEEARHLCHAMLAAPCHAEESYAARHLLGRLDKRSRATPARGMLNDGPVMELDFAPSVESAVLEAMQAEGWQGAHSENWVWNALFGLLLWDAIYDPLPGAFVQPLQIAPTDLHSAEFYIRRQARIETDLARLHDVQECVRHLQARHDAKLGTSNPFVGWHAALPGMIEAHLHHVPALASAAVLRHFAQDVKRRKRGFPDLFLWREGACRFVEVKSPNDQLSPAQYHWLQFFAEAGLDVAVQRVRWRVTEDA